jgi:glycosyltransferase involved in cell wall biosynthesis
MPTVDVVVPCYNYGRFLEQCVNSVLQQAGVDVHILVIDDASTDNSASIGEDLARADERVSFTRHLVNARHIATYNEGIETISADYFLLLSADDYLLPGALGRAVGLMERDRNVAFCFGNAQGAEAETADFIRGGGLSRSELILGGEQFARLSGAKNMVPTPTAVVRTSVQKRVGGYLKSLPHSGDMEMWLRLAAEGSVGFINADQAVYRKHDSNMSIAYEGTADLQARELALREFFKHGALKLDPSRQLERDLLHDLATEAFRYASMALNRGNVAAAADFENYGLSLSPKARLSANRLKLAVKRTLRLLNPAKRTA